MQSWMVLGLVISFAPVVGMFFGRLFPYCSGEESVFGIDGCD